MRIDCYKILNSIYLLEENLKMKNVLYIIVLVFALFGATACSSGSSSSGGGGAAGGGVEDFTPPVEPV